MVSLYSVPLTPDKICVLYQLTLLDSSRLYTFNYVILNLRIHDSFRVSERCEMILFFNVDGKQAIKDEIFAKVHKIESTKILVDTVRRPRI